MTCVLGMGCYPYSFPAAIICLPSSQPQFCGADSTYHIWPGQAPMMAVVAGNQ